MPRLYWHKMEGRKDISFGETPFTVPWQILRFSTASLGPSNSNSGHLRGKRYWLQSTWKIECQAHVEVKSFTLYPDFAVSKDEKEGLSMQRLQCLQEEKITALRQSWL